MSKYIEIILREHSKSGKTKICEVVSLRSGCGLGTVSWYSTWRQYTFQPYAGTEWNHDCLKEIAEYLIRENEIHKVKRRHGKC